MKGTWSAELKKGSLTVSVLALISREPMYGYQIIKALQTDSEGYFDLKEGTLYPILYRLEERGYMKSEWLQKEPDRPPRNYYSITPAGRQALKEAAAEFYKMAESTKKIIEKAERGPQPGTTAQGPGAKAREPDPKAQSPGANTKQKGAKGQ